jgi:hypothetical protein
VLLILQAYNLPLADYEVKAIHDAAGGRYTEQRLRTARHELVESGQVVHQGEKQAPSGYRTRAWRIA